MSFKISAIIISIPLDSWAAMQVCKIREGSWGVGGEGRKEGGKEGDRMGRGRERENMYISRFPKQGPRT